MNNQKNNANYMNTSSPRYRMEPSGGHNTNYQNIINRLQPKFLKPIVQTKVIEVPKEVYVEKIIEVPQIKVVEKIVEDIKPVYKYKNVYKSKPVYVEKVKQVDKIVYEEKIIEVPQKKFVEKIVEVPVYVNREKIIPVPRYMVVEKVIPVLKTTKSEKVVEIPEIKSPFIDVNEKLKESEKIDVKDLKDNQTTQITDAEQIRIFSQMTEAATMTNTESTVKIETNYDYNINNVTQEQAQEQAQEQHEQQAQQMQREKQEQKYLRVNNHQHYTTDSVYKGQNVTQQHSQNVYKSDRFPAYSQMFYQTHKYIAANSKVNKSSNALPRIKIAKTPNSYSKNCYCSCN